MSEEEKVVSEEAINPDEQEEGLEEEQKAQADSVEADKESGGEDDAKSENEQTPETEDYKEKWLRVTAEYQNFRTRTAKEKNEIYVNANEKIVTQLLEVVDNFERALESFTGDDKSKEGIELIYKQFLAILEKEHVKEIPAEGAAFDPKYHMAVQTMLVEGLESDMVAKVIKKGYTLGDKVIRPSMVVVSQ